MGQILKLRRSADDKVFMAARVPRRDGQESVAARGRKSQGLCPHMEGHAELDGGRTTRFFSIFSLWWTIKNIESSTECLFK